jgi:MFS family permease
VSFSPSNKRREPLSLNALQTVVATALPTIAHALNADQFIWVGTSYSIATAVALPLTGGLNEESFVLCYGFSVILTSMRI